MAVRTLSQRDFISEISVFTDIFPILLSSPYS
jgi:hypothetical protein